MSQKNNWKQLETISNTLEIVCLKLKDCVSAFLLYVTGDLKKTERNFKL